MSPQVKSLLSGVILALALSSAVVVVVSMAQAGRQTRLQASHAGSDWLPCSECLDGSCSPDEQANCFEGEGGEGSLDPNDCSRGVDESNQETCDQAVGQ